MPIVRLPSGRSRARPFSRPFGKGGRAHGPELGAKHARRVRRMLQVGAVLLLVLSLNWLVFFALSGAWLVAGLHLATAGVAVAALVMVRREHVRLASFTLVGCLFVVCIFISAVLDLPSPASPRTAHLYLLALGVGASLVFRGERKWIAHGAPLACFVAFFGLGAWSGGVPSAYALPEAVRVTGTWVNSLGALVALYSLLQIMQADLVERNALEADLQKALLRDELHLHYQPQVGADGAVFGAEALLRWTHPTRGAVSPGEFIPAAERSGLILPLGEWVLQRACAQLVAWAAQPATAGLTLAVNVSAQQFREPDFVQQVLAVVQRHQAPARRLKLELTESMLVADIEDIVQKMTALKAQGIGFSLDDFGTGFSSLAYLKRLPLDQLKIDQAFVRDVLTDPNDAAIACAIITLGQNLGLAVIAEGVETEAHRRFLADHGCHLFQGYLFGRPAPAAEFEAQLAAPREPVSAGAVAAAAMPGARADPLPA